MTISKVSNIILTVSDLEKSLRFYRDVLGMSVKHTVPGEFVFLDGGDIDLALRQGSGAVNAGFTEVVFEVQDVRVTYEMLQSKGIDFPCPPRAVTRDETRELFATDFRDPDGHILSITGWVAKGSQLKIS